MTHDRLARTGGGFCLYVGCHLYGVQGRPAATGVVHSLVCRLRTGKKILGNTLLSVNDPRDLYLVTEYTEMFYRSCDVCPACHVFYRARTSCRTRNVERGGIGEPGTKDMPPKHYSQDKKSLAASLSDISCI